MISPRANKHVPYLFLFRANSLAVSTQLSPRLEKAARAKLEAMEEEEAEDLPPTSAMTPNKDLVKAVTMYVYPSKISKLFFF